MWTDTIYCTHATVPFLPHLYYILASLCLASIKRSVRSFPLNRALTVFCLKNWQNWQIRQNFFIAFFYTLRIFHTPPFPHSSFSTLLIFHTPHLPHSSFSTLRTPRFPPNHKRLLTHNCIYRCVEKTNYSSWLRNDIVIQSWIKWHVTEPNRSRRLWIIPQRVDKHGQN